MEEKKGMGRGKEGRWEKNGEWPASVFCPGAPEFLVTLLISSKVGRF